MKSVILLFWALVGLLLLYINYLCNKRDTRKMYKLKEELQENSIYLNLTKNEKEVLKILSCRNCKSVDKYVVDKVLEGYFKK